MFAQKMKNVYRKTFKGKGKGKAFTGKQSKFIMNSWLQRLLRIHGNVYCLRGSIRKKEQEPVKLMCHVES